MKFKSIAIDGPAGAGKSTIAKLLAKRLNFEYLDTGAMYRLYTFYFLDKGLDIKDQELVNSHIDKIKIEIHNGSFYMDGRNVDKEIRSEFVTKNVSLLSSYKEIRKKLVEKQREISKMNNIVVDGRDIGSHVLKSADLKIFLTASPDIRARRRYDEIKPIKISYKQVLEDILERDNFDSNREISPLVMADDAILLDSSLLSIDEVVEKIYRIAEENNVI